MQLVGSNREPALFDLRVFGVLLAVFFGFVGWAVLRSTDSLTTAMAVWGTALLLVGTYYAVPNIRRMLYLAWMTAFYPVGWLVSHALMAVVYYLVIMPIGLSIRMMGRDPLDRTLDRSANTYWVPRSVSSDRSRYFRQF